MKDLEANKPSKNERRTWPQHLAAFLASLGALSGGMVLGWSNVVQPYLHEEDVTWTGEEATGNRSYPVLSDYENNLVGTLPYVGAIFGSLFSAEIADSLGRRRFLLATAVPYILCWLLVMTTELLPIIFVSQIIAGLALGSTCTITPMYIEEIAEDSIRGALMLYMDVGLTLGSLITYVVGAYFSYFYLAVISSCVPLIFFLTFYFMPESPVYLLYKGERENAVKVLRWLHWSTDQESDDDVQKGISILEKMLGQFTAIDTTPLLTRILHIPCFVKDVLFNINITKATVHATIIVCGLMCFQQLCGLNTIITLSISLLEERRNLVKSQFVCYVIVSSTETLSVIMAAFVVDRVGRRFLLMLSGILMTLCLGALVINSFLHVVHVYSWILILISSIYIVAFSIGVGPIPFVLCAELSPMKDKNSIEPLANFINWGLSFYVNQYLNDYLQDLGGLESFSIFCVLCIVGTTFVYAWVPETKCKSREEIQTALTEEETTSPSSSEC